jgi:hypothetical protein
MQMQDFSQGLSPMPEAQLSQLSELASMNTMSPISGAYLSQSHFDSLMDDSTSATASPQRAVRGLWWREGDLLRNEDAKLEGSELFMGLDAARSPRALFHNDDLPVSASIVSGSRSWKESQQTKALLRVAATDGVSGEGQCTILVQPDASASHTLSYSSRSPLRVFTPVIARYVRAILASNEDLTPLDIELLMREEDAPVFLFAQQVEPDSFQVVVRVGSYFEALDHLGPMLAHDAFAPGHASSFLTAVSMNMTALGTVRDYEIVFEA